MFDTVGTLTLGRLIRTKSEAALQHNLNRMKCWQHTGFLPLAAFACPMRLLKLMKHLAVSKAALAAENRERLRRAAA
jgi:hypothetical protein